MHDLAPLRMGYDRCHRHYLPSRLFLEVVIELVLHCTSLATLPSCLTDLKLLKSQTLMVIVYLRDLNESTRSRCLSRSQSQTQPAPITPTPPSVSPVPLPGDEETPLTATCRASSWRLVASVPPHYSNPAGTLYEPPSSSNWHAWADFSTEH
jgi:hypothetical protein